MGFSLQRRGGEVGSESDSEPDSELDSEFDSEDWDEGSCED